MFHLNELLKEEGIAAKLLEMTMPQTYLATSINDFMCEKKNIIPSTFSKLLGYIMTYKPGASHLIGKAAIFVVSVEYRQDNNLTAMLKDTGHGSLANPITMNVHSPHDRYKSDMAEGMSQYGEWYHVSLAGFIFDPKRPVEEAELVAVKRNLVLPSSPLSSSTALEYAKVIA